MGCAFFPSCLGSFCYINRSYFNAVRKKKKEKEKVEMMSAELEPKSQGMHSHSSLEVSAYTQYTAFRVSFHVAIVVTSARTPKEDEHH